MPWKATCPMKERMRFISHYLEGELSMSGLCREMGIPPIGWVHRPICYVSEFC